MLKKSKTKTLIATTLLGTFLFTSAAHASAFTDIESPHVDYVHQHGLMVGITKTTFEPAQPLNRAQFVTIMQRLSNDTSQHVAPFQDVPADAWYRHAVGWAYHYGIVNGTSATTFSPNDPLTREQMVALTDKFLKQKGINIPPNQKEFMDMGEVSPWAKNSVIKAGYTMFPEDFLQPKNPCTRLDAARIMRTLHTIKSSPSPGWKPSNPPYVVPEPKPEPKDEGLIQPEKEKELPYTPPEYASTPEEHEREIERLDAISKRIKARTKTRLEAFEKRKPEILGEAVNLTPDQKEFLDLVNEARRNAGVPEVKPLPMLNRLAEKRAKEANMKIYQAGGMDHATSALVHTRPDGKNFDNIILDEEFNVCGVLNYFWENSVNGNDLNAKRTMKDYFNSLYKSPNHRKIMLDENHRYMGSYLYKGKDTNIRSFMQTFACIDDEPNSDYMDQEGDEKLE